MAKARASAYAPATVANLGVGFDILGMALTGSGDRITAITRSEMGVSIREITGDGGKLPRDPLKNIAAISATYLLKEGEADFGVELIIEKGISAGGGLGSSAASAVAASVAVNALFDEPLPQAVVLAASLEGEAAISGYHADNVAPALFGGLTLVTGITMADIRHLPIPTNLCLAMVTPHVIVPTVEARAALPATIALKTMVHQTAAVARLVDALYRDDLTAVAEAMSSDEVVEQAREHLIPHLADMRRRARELGALAVVISGAGPTLCTVCDSEAIALKVGEALVQAYHERDMGADYRVSRVLAEAASASIE